MSQQHDDRPHTPPGPRLTVDRVACTGKGICASLLPEAIELDGWGYPIVHEAQVDREMGDIAIRMCPARALSWALVASDAGGTSAPARRPGRREFAS